MKPMRFRFVFIFPILCLISLLNACASDSKHWVELAGKRYQVELAMDEASRARGLMFRDHMPEGQGMLFIHERMQPLAYWMKNTAIALDILYFDAERKLVSQQRDVPPCSAGDACPSYPSVRPALYVLELNAGQAALIDLRNGEQLLVSPSIQNLP